VVDLVTCHKGQIITEWAAVEAARSITDLIDQKSQILIAKNVEVSIEEIGSRRSLF
jgi:hypothetical protein